MQRAYIVYDGGVLVGRMSKDDAIGLTGIYPQDIFKYARLNKTYKKRWRFEYAGKWEAPSGGIRLKDIQTKTKPIISKGLYKMSDHDFLMILREHGNVASASKKPEEAIALAKAHGIDIIATEKEYHWIYEVKR